MSGQEIREPDLDGIWTLMRAAATHQPRLAAYTHVNHRGYVYSSEEVWVEAGNLISLRAFPPP
ncbi:MAG: hypothetical protein KF760_25600 [Candidatus Eremiobacteraeota bacterium]|nr:hypothetical protein [Candidatus Eremiobacteraeota bacterium]MCW5866853.1 hypothetical protein [Candidatus Eremiobacteraeota bacterium]